MIDTTAVEICDLVKRYGHTTAVLGPNGAGKTTTIEICEGYRRPDAGEEFFVAVQWHPEAGADPRLIKALVTAASSRMSL